MTKVQKLELEIEKLKQEISDLRRDMLALSLRQPISVPYIAPLPLPNTTPVWPTPRYPYIGDPVTPNGWPTITCGVQNNANEGRAIPFLSAMKQAQNVQVSN